MTVHQSQIQIRARRQEVPAACEFVLTMAAKAGIDEQGLYHCQLAVDEVCNNIIEHGYGGERSDQVIDVLCTQQSSAFLIEIIDDSPPFDLLKHPAPDPMTELQQRADGGWGVYIIMKIMHDVRYEYRQGRNHLIMTKLLPSSAADDRSSHSVTVTAVANDREVITPAGQIDSSGSDELQRILSDNINAGRKNLVLDMSGVDYISGKGLKMLVAIWKRAQDAKGDLVLVGLQPGMQEVIRSLGFDLIFTIYSTLDEAAASDQTRS